MNCLVTAGNTVVPIDRVRSLTNHSTGLTGTRIAWHCCQRGHEVTLLTSRPEAVASVLANASLPARGWTVQTYHTFQELQEHMERLLGGGSFDVVIHCAAVSDYLAGGIFALGPGTRFRADGGYWQSDGSTVPTLLDRAAAKVKSDEPELWLRLVRAPKLAECIRGTWSFRGVLVTFKLEVDVSDESLLASAERSRRQLEADLVVANTLAGMDSWAYLGPVQGQYERLVRQELAARLLDAVEGLHKEKTRG